MRISIIGMGHVGLCLGVCFAEKGLNVIGVDIDSKRVETINAKVSPFYEANLDELLSKVVDKKLLYCTTNIAEAVKDSDITFITVGTPSNPDGSLNLRYVKAAAKSIGEELKKKQGYHLIVLKSTVTPGTTGNIVNPIIEKYAGKSCGVDFGLCFDPEFLREGMAIYDLQHPDRVVIGEFDKKSGDVLEGLYHQFYGNQLPTVIRTNPPTAELIKHANNAFLATKISFINTIANICQKVPSADVTVVAKAIGLDKRINPYFLNAGLGWGGSCFPKDSRDLVAFSKKLNYEPLLIDATIQVNELQPFVAIELAKKLTGNLRGKRIAILGLTFKPNTDDMRDAVSIKIINKLLNLNANVAAYDPKAMPEAKHIFRDKIEYASSAIDCIGGADCCIVVTEWNEFKTLQPEDFIAKMREPAVVDGRRIYDSDTFSGKLKYATVGQGTK